MKLRAIFLVFSLVCIHASLRGQGIITTVAGTGLSEYIGDGAPATDYTMFYPESICFDKKGNIFIADFSNNRIRKLSSLDTIGTIAGGDTPDSTGDGGPATAAHFKLPDGVCIDTAGNLFITDLYYALIRKIDAVTGIITKVCGSGINGFGGDGGLAISATLNSPGRACVDRAGNIYIPDNQNHRIRKVTAATGIISTFAGTGTAGYSGDNGAAVAAKLNYPYYICTDTADNLYFSETGNHTIRRIDHITGIITTVAGTGVYGYTGDGGPATNATLDQPMGVFADKHNNIYVADFYNEVIREIDASGTIHTIAGNGHPGYSGDNGPATNAKLHEPLAVCVNDSGYIFIADGFNSVIRMVTPLRPTGITNITDHKIRLFPNPAKGIIMLRIEQAERGTIEVLNLLGQCVYKVVVKNMDATTLINLEGNQPGIYYLQLTLAEQRLVEKIILE